MLKRVKCSTYPIAQLVESPELSPLPLEVITNKMGINLCSVESISFKKQEDGQLLDLSIKFIPSEKS